MPAKYITPPENCTGCGLCANVCPKDAISMVWNTQGFLVPQVDTSACINCGLCVRMCPAQPDKLKKPDVIQDQSTPTPTAFGAWNKDTAIHKASSSGGIFTALSRLIFAAGGCVFGVIWNNKNTASFAKAENEEELAAMRGSKYTQAIPGMVYREVKNELGKGRQVLFCGTSCQVHALKQYLRKDYENLLLVDILCHGVPSRNLLNAYISKLEDTTGKELAQIQFREKAGDWHRYQVRKIFTDGSTLSHRNGEDTFMRLFVGDFALNRACYSCPHATFPRVGDITLGDFWGDLYSLHPEWPICEGIGSVLANTARGESKLHQLAESEQIILHREPLQNLIDGQRSTYLRQTHPPKNRESTLARLKEESVASLYKELCGTVKFGIFRFRRNGVIHKAYNKLRRFKGYITGK